MNTNKFRLVGKIKGLSGEIAHLKTHPIKKKVVSGYDSSQWWTQKIRLALKSDTRHHLLAYAFQKHLRTGAFPYLKVEQKCEIKPSIKDIVAVLMSHNFLEVASKNFRGEPCVIVRQFSEEQFSNYIAQWINGEV